MYQTDPRVGNQRRKSLIGKVATKAMARKGYTGGVSKFGKLANAGKQTRGLRPSRGANANHPGGGRPGGYQNFLDGLSGGGFDGPGGYGAGVNTAPVQAPIPESYTNPVQNTLTPQEAAAQPSGYTNTNPPPNTPTVQEYNPDYNPATNSSINGAGGTDITVGGGGGPGGVYFGAPASAAGTDWTAGGFFNADGTLVAPNAPLTQAAPSAPITAPGGLIPLGGGRYYDPATDTIRGGGGRRLE